MKCETKKNKARRLNFLRRDLRQMSDEDADAKQVVCSVPFMALVNRMRSIRRTSTTTKEDKLKKETYMKNLDDKVMQTYLGKREREGDVDSSRNAAKRHKI